MHGGDIYRNKIELDFSVNINPLGPPPNVFRILSEGINATDRYPDPTNEHLVSAVAELFSVSKDEVVLGNGASEVIMAICHALMPKGAMVLSPGFSGYEYAIKGACRDCSIFYHSLLKEDDFSLKENILQHLKEDKPNLLFLTNPNNPNGKTIEQKLLEEIIKVCEEQNTIVVLDECFLPLTGWDKKQSFTGRINDFKNIIVLRAFTKTFAIPGVRLGYALCNKDLATDIKRHLPEWNLSVFAQMAGVECLKHFGYLEQAIELIHTERAYLTSALEKLGCQVYPSDANFILFYSDRTDLWERLKDAGILIRDCRDYKGLSQGYYRIAVKNHAENEQLIYALKKNI